MTYSLDLITRMVYYYKNSNCTLREIEANFKVSKSSLQRWINKDFTKINKQELMYKNRILILNYIKRSLNHNPFQTLEMLKNKIIKKFNISLTKKTVCNYLKIIGYSKKKVVKRLYNKSLKDHLLNRKKMKKLLKKINKDDIICIDESGINRDLYLKSGWCKRNQKLISYISNTKLPKNYSLIMAISNKQIIKYELHKNKAINTDLYYSFLEDILKNIKNKYILMDNVSFHKSKRILELIKKSSNKVLFIPPYSPDFNPIEEVFSELKYFIRRNITPITINKDVNSLLKTFSKKRINLEGYYRHAFN